MKKIFYIFSFFIILNVQAQNTDSLEELLVNDLSEVERVEVLNKLSRTYLFEDVDLAFKYNFQSLKLLEKLDEPRHQAEATFINGRITQLYGNLNEALNILFDALKIWYELDNSNKIMECQRAIGEIYRALTIFDLANKYLHLALNLAFKINDSLEISYTYNRMAAVAFEEKEMKKTLLYCDSTLAFHNKKDNGFLANTYNIIGAVYHTMGKEQEGLKNLHKSVYLFSKSKEKIHISNAYTNIMTCYLSLGNYDSAIYYGVISFNEAKKNKIAAYQATSAHLVAMAYEKVGDYKNAHRYLGMHIDVQYNILNQKIAHQISELETRFEMDQQELKNKELLAKTELQEKNILIQRIIIFIILFAVVIIIFFLYYANKSKKRLLEQKNMIEQQKKDLEELTQTKNKMFSIIAHDLKNPFNALLGFSTLLLEELNDKSDTPSYQYAKMLNRSGTTFYILLDNLLEWTKSQSKNVSYNYKMNDISSIIFENIKFSQLNLDEKKIELTYKVKNNVLAYFDKNSIDTVFRNLLSNAIKFTPVNGRILIILEEKENEVVIEITDNGIGINKENLESIFSIDKEVSLGTNNEKGSGLGLVLCKEFVKANRGEISIESEEDSGTSIRFSLPKNES
jgi:signal transduction histidine kinase